MKRNTIHLMYRLLILATVCIFIPKQAIGQTWDGSADSNWPGNSLSLENTTKESAEISTPGQLAQLAALVNQGKSFEGKTIKLTADIDLESSEWTPIGDNNNPFKGTFSGEKADPEEGCHTISNLAIESEQTYLGLFGYLEAKATVKKLNIIISDKGLTGKGANAYIGGVAGFSAGKIRECHISGGMITAKSTGSQSSHAGGIVGQNQGSSAKIESCSVLVDILSEGTMPIAGGITAINENSAYVGGCSYEGNIKTNSDNGDDDVGGIAGKNNNSEISICHSAGSIEGALNAGGIASQNTKSSFIIGCYSTANVSGEVGSSNVGGIAGKNTQSNILNCFSTNAIYGLYAGGIAGKNDQGKISKCYATGEIGGTYTGGITGISLGSQYYPCTISYCYSTSKISGTSSYTGGITSLAYQYSTIDHCIALNITSEEVTNRIGYDNGATFSNNYASFLIPGERTEVALDNEDGADLTTLNFNDGSCTALYGWSEDWENLESEYLPTLAGLGVEQPLVPRKPYLAFTVVYEEPEGGVITVKEANATDPNRTIESGEGVPGLCDLVITATPKKGYALLSLTVNEADFVCDETHCVTEDVKIEATFKRLPPPYIPTYYNVILPEVKGVTTKPKPGKYIAEECYSFRFFLNLDKGYESSQPIVKANGKIITPRESDGKYIIRNIITDMNITIEGIDNPTGNTPIAGKDKVKVQAVGSSLYIHLPKAEKLYIYTLSGLLYGEHELPAGDSQIQLTTGVYFVKVGDETYKVVV